MALILRNYLRKLEAAWYRWKTKRALALHLRGEVRSDGLNLISLCNRLEVQWRARDIHPWDRDLPEGERMARFEEQCMQDTETAIVRLFNALPHIDVIDLSVIGRTQSPMIEGTVSRCDLEMARSLPSVRMRLRELGVTDHQPLAG